MGRRDPVPDGTVPHLRDEPRPGEAPFGDDPLAEPGAAGRGGGPVETGTPGDLGSGGAGAMGTGTLGDTGSLGGGSPEPGAGTSPDGG